ncbi:hypothetical protein [Nocardia wallacei]|nr:hypothetical protein [Nocardia wallacei]
MIMPGMLEFGCGTEVFGTRATVPRRLVDDPSAHLDTVVDDIPTE